MGTDSTQINLQKITSRNDIDALGGAGEQPLYGVIQSPDDIEGIQTYLLAQSSNPFIIHQLLTSIRQESLLLLGVLFAQIGCHTAAQHRVAFKL